MRLAFVIGCLAIAALPPPGYGRSHDPVAAVQDFLNAVRRGDCSRAWTHFSAASQAYIENRSREMIRRAPYYADAFAPRNLYCRPTSVHRFHSYQPRTARLIARSGTHATVAIERHESTDFRLPGFFPRGIAVHMAEMRLVEDSGLWKIAVP